MLLFRWLAKLTRGCNKFDNLVLPMEFSEILHLLHLLWRRLLVQLDNCTVPRYKLGIGKVRQGVMCHWWCLYHDFWEKLIACWQVKHSCSGEVMMEWPSHWTLPLFDLSAGNAVIVEI